MNESSENNRVTISGTVETEPIFSHEVYGEEFYMFFISVPRLSDARDTVRVLVSKRLFCGDADINIGSKVLVKGQFRSYNNYSGEGSRLVLSVFAKSIENAADTEDTNPNTIYLDGHICKPPMYRKTPFGREITDILLAVNRSYGKSDYIPIIAWGRNARYLAEAQIGTHIKIWGRIQSRKYQKQISESEAVEKTAYEVSVSKIED